MLVVTHHPTHTPLIFSDDRGRTRSKRKSLITDSEGRPQSGIALGLTNVNNGRLLAFPDSVAHGRWSTEDFVETWKKTPVDDSVDKRYVWDPLLVEKNAGGQATKMFEASWRSAAVACGASDGDYSQVYLRIDREKTVSFS